MIPYGRQFIDEHDINAVVEVLKSEYITQGTKISEFEETVADYCGAKYAVAVSSGTAALHIACIAAKLGKGDILWTSPNTFVASANCALYCGATSDFVDIDARTYNMGIGALEAKLIEASRRERLPSVVIPVHFAGQSCEMHRIGYLRDKYKFTVIEDACHALGGSWKENKIGSCRFSDMAVFSFHPIKSITTGEGGLITTNNKEFYNKLVLLRTHGITRDPNLMQGEPVGPWCYHQIELGMNYRLTDIQATLGLSQLKRLDAFVSRRNELAEHYIDSLSGQPVVLPWQHPDSYSAFHLFVIRLKLDEIERNREEIFNIMRREGVGVNVHYIPVHLQPYYSNLGFSKGHFPEAEKYYEEAITLPLYPLMSEEEQDHVINTLKETLC